MYYMDTLDLDYTLWFSRYLRWLSQSTYYFKPWLFYVKKSIVIDFLGNVNRSMVTNISIDLWHQRLLDHHHETCETSETWFAMAASSPFLLLTLPLLPPSMKRHELRTTIIFQSGLIYCWSLWFHCTSNNQS